MKPQKNKKEFDRRMKSSIKRYLVMLLTLLCVALIITWKEHKDEPSTDASFNLCLTKCAAIYGK